MRINTSGFKENPMFDKSTFTDNKLSKRNFSIICEHIENNKTFLYVSFSTVWILNWLIVLKMSLINGNYAV